MAALPCLHPSPPQLTLPWPALPRCRSWRPCSSRRTALTTPARWVLGRGRWQARGALLARGGYCLHRPLQSQGLQDSPAGPVATPAAPAPGCWAQQHPPTLPPPPPPPPQVLTAVIKRAQLPGDNIDNRDSFANVKASAAFRWVLLGAGRWAQQSVPPAVQEQLGARVEGAACVTRCRQSRHLCTASPAERASGAISPGPRHVLQPWPDPKQYAGWTRTSRSLPT